MISQRMICLFAISGLRHTLSGSPSPVRAKYMYPPLNISVIYYLSKICLKRSSAYKSAVYIGLSKKL